VEGEEGCKIKVVLVDFDGTVVNTMKLLAEKASELISRSIGISKEKAKELYLSLAGRPFREQLRIIGIRDPTLLEALAKEFEEYKINLLRNLRPDPLVIKRIQLLRRNGLKVALSTNSECWVVKSNKELVKLFDVILCHDPVTGERKGRPHLEKVKAIFNVTECNIIFIGDSDYDIELYRSLGIKSYRTRGLWDPEDKSVEEVLRGI
jgi:beta-phosphoglucomutase-like phosphatase (HAD superfamily)